MITMSWGYSDTEPRRHFATRLAHAVWGANIEYCKLHVSIMDYQDNFQFNVHDYFRFRPPAAFDSLSGQMNQTGGEKVEKTTDGT